MPGYAIACAMVFSLLGGVASAQMMPPQSPATEIAAPPPGTLSTSDTRKTIDSNGTETDSSRTTYRNEAGVADDVHTTRTTHPAASTTTSSTSSSSTATR